MEDRGAAPSTAPGVRAASSVAAALVAVNVVGYLVAVAAARHLPTASYGEFTALLGGLLVACVPAVALQATVARAVAQRPASELEGPRERALLLRCAAVGMLSSGGAALAAPLVAAFLQISVAGPLWLAAQLAPFAVLAGAMGILQGAQRFAALATAVVAQAVGKTFALLPLLRDRSPAAALAALGVGTAAAAFVALLLVKKGVLLRRGAAGPTLGELPGRRELGAAVSGLLALLVLANLDLLLARNVLPATESGRYAAGSVLAKAAFWLPQSIAVLVFPRLASSAANHQLLRRALGLVIGLGGLELLGCGLLAGPVLRLTFGQQYTSLAAIAPLYVVQGAALAVLQLLVYAAIAARDPVTGRCIAAVVALEAVVLLTVRPVTPTPVIVLAAGLAIALSAALVWRAGVVRASQWPASSQVRPTPTLTSSGTDNG